MRPIYWCCACDRTSRDPQADGWKRRLVQKLAGRVEMWSCPGPHRASTETDDTDPESV